MLKVIVYRNLFRIRTPKRSKVTIIVHPGDSDTSEDGVHGGSAVAPVRQPHAGPVRRVRRLPAAAHHQQRIRR